MAYATHCKSIIRDEFFKHIFEFLPSAKHHRNCPVLDDATWLEAGVRRCLGIFQSGRDFLQQLADVHHTEIRISTLFESFKSTRRLQLLGELLDESAKRMRHEMPDAFASFPCLADYDLFAGDGHFIAAACHDRAARSDNTPAPKASGASNGRVASVKYATGHLYALDLRSHAMSHLTVADQVGRKKEHELRALKRQTIDTLRQGAAKGRKVLYVWDRAAIDFRQWHEWKHGSGIYFLSREKDNMNLEILGNQPFEAGEPVNKGVLFDQIVATSVGVSMRRVGYQDHETGNRFHYITNLPASVPPGLVALLYKVRWDLEKVFDEFKNKLAETKSWASSANAKTVQARMLCLTHNLMTLMEQVVQVRCGVRNEVEFRRRAKRRESGPPSPCAADLVVRRLTQRTVKFIRWLKNHFDQQPDWEHAIARLARIYARS